jgi:intracellular multiplication protein IcmE
MTDTTADNPQTASHFAAGQPVSISKHNLKTVFGSGVGRLSAILLGVALTAMMGYGGYKLFSRPTGPGDRQGNPVSAPPSQVQDPVRPVSTAEGAKRAELNGQAAAQAAQDGKSYIAPPVVTDKGLDASQATPGTGPIDSSVLRDQPQRPYQSQPVTIATPTQQAQLVGAAGATPPVPPAAPQRQAAPVASAQAQPAVVPVDPELKKFVYEQLMQVAKPGTGQHGGFSTTYVAVRADAQPGPQARPPVMGAVDAQGVTAGKAGGTGAVGADPTAARKKPDVFATLGDTCYATLDNGINTDDTKYVFATIHSCQMNLTANAQAMVGARVKGKIEMAQDQVRVTFDRLILRGRRTGSFTIEAIAVTEDEARSGIGKEVDHHYFSRYFSLGLSSLLTGFGKAAQMQTGTAVITAGSTTVTTAPIDTNRETKIALGEMGQSFGSEVRKDFSRPTTVSAPRDMGIGVIFVNDVTLDQQK